jgi:carbon storage regulator
MLVLSRRKDESIIIGENIEVTIIDIQGDVIRLGIDAPKEVSIYRKELWIDITEANQAATQTVSNIADKINLLKNYKPNND